MKDGAYKTTLWLRSSIKHETRHLTPLAMEPPGSGQICWLGATVRKELPAGAGVNG